MSGESGAGLLFTLNFTGLMKSLSPTSATRWVARLDLPELYRDLGVSLFNDRAL
jgi:hypothetical protein